MQNVQISEGIYRIAANIYYENLFEGMWPIPHGVSMNAYLVRGEKKALIDGVGTWRGLPESLEQQLEDLGETLETIDYFVVNHLEPDHTGWIEKLKTRRRPYEIITTAKGAKLFEAFFGMTDHIRVVDTGDTLDLGDGFQLYFESIPNVHWPETMATFEMKTKTLFSCDAFGSYGAVEDKPFDEMLSEKDKEFFRYETLRYYANIVASFSSFVEKAVGVVTSMQINAVAPSHGIIWRKNPKEIIGEYCRLASYKNGPAKEKITILWSTMYGMTKKGLQTAIDAVKSEGVELSVLQIPETHASDVLAHVWESTGVILAMPTYEYKMFPPMAIVLDELGRKKMKGKLAFRFGSYGWSGGAEKELSEILERGKMKWELLPGVEFNGSPLPEDLKKIEESVRELAKKVKETAIKG